ncbi:hypothetical protein [uncultured Paludibaculum sp.]|uniref:hypothetical protein n=1 Tax=uncultured Paludibaculum sp. TaxID=1765020 RepID=UPI002AAAF1A6|nr:hypothetical protein [uncultured Paludibaculum sp.]
MADLSIALAGISNGLKLAETTAARVARAPVAPAQTSNPTDVVDFSAEMIALLQAKNTVAANVEVAKTFDDVNEAIVNLLA